jgi:hypothetical protein
MARGPTLRLLACLGVAAVLGAGCSSTPQASTSLPSSSSAKPSSSLPPLGPPDFPVPDKARTQDAAGAEAAMRYYLVLIAHQSGKAGQPLRDLSRDCGFCKFVADRADQDATAGYRFEGGAITVEDMPAPAVHDGIAEFAFTAGQSKVTVTAPDGSAVAGRGDEAVSGYQGAAAMSWDPSRRAWIVTQLFFQKP